MKTYYVDWYGPFSYDEIIADEHWSVDDDYLKSNGLYLLAGKVKWQRGESCAQYIGLTKNEFKKRFRSKHEGIEKTAHDLNIYLGKIAYIKNVNKSMLENVESVLIYFSEPPLNKKKTRHPLTENCTVISRFFDRYGKQRRNQKQMLRDVPDVLSWDADLETLYFTERLKQK